MKNCWATWNSCDRENSRVRLIPNTYRIWVMFPFISAARSPDTYVGSAVEANMDADFKILVHLNNCNISRF